MSLPDGWERKSNHYIENSPYTITGSKVCGNVVYQLWKGRNGLAASSDIVDCFEAWRLHQKEHFMGVMGESKK